MHKYCSYIRNLLLIIFMTLFCQIAYADFAEYEKKIEHTKLFKNLEQDKNKAQKPISSPPTDINPNNIKLSNHSANEEVKKIIAANSNKNSKFVNQLIKLNYDFYRYPPQYYNRPNSEQNADLPPAYFKSYYTEILLDALKKDNLNIVRMLAEQYNMINIHFANHDNLLLMAANTGAINVMRFLLMKHMNVNYRNNLGITALHIACMRNDDNMAKLLLTMGANYTIPDKDGNTAIQYIDENNEKMNLLFITYIDNSIKQIERHR